MKKIAVGLFSLLLIINISTQSAFAPIIEVEAKSNTSIVYITKTGKKFHRSNCRSLSKSKIKIDRKKAISLGYTACKVCKP